MDELILVIISISGKGIWYGWVFIRCRFAFPVLGDFCNGVFASGLTVFGDSSGLGVFDFLVGVLGVVASFNGDASLFGEDYERKEKQCYTYNLHESIK